jgi:hypothetical protein
MVGKMEIGGKANYFALKCKVSLVPPARVYLPLKTSCEG